MRRKVRLSNYTYFSKRKRGEGIRIGCTRYLVRGVPNKKYASWDIFDVWLPTLAPSRKLLAWVKRSNLDEEGKWKTFVQRYKNEMRRSDPRQTIRVIAALAKTTPISIGCYCQTSRCHRFVLERLIRSAAAGRL